MPLAGRKPTPEGQPKQFRGKTAEWTEVPNVPNENYPRLPESRGLTDDERKDRRFRKSTQSYYKTIAQLPHAALWGPGEWEFLYATCEVREAYYDDPKRAVAYLTELRNREKILGTTDDFRRDLRIRYVEPKEVTDTAPAGVTNLDEFRNI